MVLLHGFPELAWSWRAVMPALADAGYHVVAPDQRGYGRTQGWSAVHGGDLTPFGFLNLVRDTLGTVHALGRRHVAAVVGHDFGSPLAAWCALLRPDVFRRVVLMSAPFPGPPRIPFDRTGGGAPPAPALDTVHRDLAALARPRKHYQWYYSSASADLDMRECAQGVHDFLRAYFHHKSADWDANRPHPLTSWCASELAKLPSYYVMDLDETMAETVAHEMPGAAAIAACRWLPDTALEVYAAEFARNGFQGGLEWYRCRTTGFDAAGLEVFSGRTVDVPACFIAGASDWGVHQVPGALEGMREACPRMSGLQLVEGAGHWVQQERPDAVSDLIVDFLDAD